MLNFMDHFKDLRSVYYQNMMNSTSNIPPQKKIYSLAERTRLFAYHTRKLIQKIPRSIAVIEDGKQVIRSSGSVGANYLEADEAFSKKDFILRIKICRKEARESAYWLDLLSENILHEHREEHLRLIKEAKELVLIFNASIRKAESTLQR